MQTVVKIYSHINNPDMFVPVQNLLTCISLCIVSSDLLATVSVMYVLAKHILQRHKVSSPW